MNDRPRRRKDLVITREDAAEGPRWAIRDPAQNTCFWFGATEYQVLDALKGEYTVRELGHMLGCRDEEQFESFEGLIQAFEDAGLLEEGKGALYAQAHQAIKIQRHGVMWGQVDLTSVGDTLALLMMSKEAPTCDCASCKILCCDYKIEAVAAEIEPLTEAAAAVGVPREQLFKKHQQHAEKGIFELARRERDECVLLTADGLCSVHARDGLDRKPQVCQLFPALPTLTPDGPRVAIRPGCAHGGVSRSPEALAEYRGLLTRIKDIRPDVSVQRAPTRVLLTGDEMVSWAAYAIWESQATNALRGAPDAYTGMQEATRLMLEPYEIPVPPLDPDALEVINGQLGLVPELSKAGMLAAGVAALPGSPQPEHRHCPPESLALVIESLLPLRLRTALEGLGVLTLMVALIDRDPRTKETPRDTTASWFRRLLTRDALHALRGVPVPVLESLVSLP